MNMKPKYTADTVCKIMQWEEGNMTQEEAVEFFQGLIDSGLAWQLQGTYGRTAKRLIEDGLCHEEAEHRKQYNTKSPFLWCQPDEPGCMSDDGQVELEDHDLGPRVYLYGPYAIAPRLEEALRHLLVETNQHATGDCLKLRNACVEARRVLDSIERKQS